MKPLAPFFLFLLAACSEPPAGSNCAAFRTGSFKNLMKVGDRAIPLQIERTEKEQVEIIPETSDTTWHHVKWIDSCTYKLYYIRSTQAMTPEQEAYRASNPFIVTITATGNDYYLFEGRRAGNDAVLIDTIWRR